MVFTAFILLAPPKYAVCMLKHVKGVESRNNFDPFDTLQHTQDLVVWLESPKSKLFRIENPLNIKKVMSKNAMSPYSIFWIG